MKYSEHELVAFKRLASSETLTISNSRRTSFSDSPRYFEVNVEEEMLKKVVPHSVATALASIVLPVPGGPTIKTPCQRQSETNCLDLTRQRGIQPENLDALYLQNKSCGTLSREKMLKAHAKTWSQPEASQKADTSPHLRIVFTVEYYLTLLCDDYLMVQYKKLHQTKNPEKKAHLVSFLLHYMTVIPNLG